MLTKARWPPRFLRISPRNLASHVPANQRLSALGFHGVQAEIAEFAQARCDVHLIGEFGQNFDGCHQFRWFLAKGHL